MGKYPTVAPYSGDILAMVALSAIDSCDTPPPKNSTNLPTTPMLRRCCDMYTVHKIAPHTFKAWQHNTSVKVTGNFFYVSASVL